MKIATPLIALAAAITFSTLAVAMGDCGGGHTTASSQQLVDATGGQTPKRRNRTLEQAAKRTFQLRVGRSQTGGEPHTSTAALKKPRFLFVGCIRFGLQSDFRNHKSTSLN